MDHDCAECNGSGELCSECCAPHHWCECEQGDVAPLAVRPALRRRAFNPAEGRRTAAQCLQGL